MFVQDFRFRHLPCPGIAAGKVTVRRLDDLHPVFGKKRQVVLGDGILVHTRVHCRGDELWGGACEDCRGEHVIRETVCKLRDDISGRRSNDDSVCFFGESDVFYLEFKITVKCICDTLVAGQRFEGDRIDEINGVAGHDHTDFRACLYEHAGKGCAFVCGDPACHAKEDGFILKIHRSCPFRIDFIKYSLSL